MLNLVELDTLFIINCFILLLCILSLFWIIYNIIFIIKYAEL
jgi:hypothetical protein